MLNGYGNENGIKISKTKTKKQNKTNSHVQHTFNFSN